MFPFVSSIFGSIYLFSGTDIIAAAGSTSLGVDQFSVDDQLWHNNPEIPDFPYSDSDKWVQR